MSRRVSRADAQAWLEAEVTASLGGPEALEAGVSPRQMARAVDEAQGVLNRSARRALGARSDGRFHPLGATKAVPRTRNAS